MNDQSQDTIKKYKDGELNWLEVAPTLADLSDKGVDARTVGVSVHAMRDIVASYRFLETRRPEVLKDPKNFNISFYVVTLLPIIYSKMKGADKEIRFNELIESVLRGEMSEIKMRKISASLDKSVVSEKPVKEIPEKSKIQNGSEHARAFENCLELMNHVIDDALVNNSYEQLRALYAPLCDKIATKLNCIADAEYLRNWENRREEKIW